MVSGGDRLHYSEPMDRAHPYDALTPDLILDAVESCGLQVTGALLALNSYENRVYRVGVEDGPPVVAKFYRPARWSDEAILEEHAFAAELAVQEIPVVAPRAFADHTLHRHRDFRFALFPWSGGRAPELERDDDRKLLGRFLGRLHRVGAAGAFAHRPTLTPRHYGRESLDFLLASSLIPPDALEPLRAVGELLLAGIEAAFSAAAVRSIRLHGDCHLGNILWREDTGPSFVDLDDCLIGPAVQDLWMLLSGEAGEKERQLATLLEGYCEFMDFDPVELHLIEPLRGLRLLRYSAWIGMRWDDPAFPRAFPWFGTQRYWEDQILTLREQLGALDEPVLSWQS